MRRTRALILGAGPAGSAAALRLAQVGHEVVLIERRVQMGEGVCGGFLGPDGMAALNGLGIAAGDIDARPIHAMRLTNGRAERCIRLPFAAHGISRAVMDRVLIERARAAGADVRTGMSVRMLDGSGARMADGSLLSGEAVFIATGKHPLRGIERRSDGAGRGAVGLRWTIRPDRQMTAVLADRVELIPFRGGYAGLLLRGDGTANLCLSIAGDRIATAGGIAPLLAELAGEQPRFAALLDRERIGGTDSIAGVPYGWRARRSALGAFRLGDQAAVIASIVGDGMAIALNSGMMAADAIGAGQGADEFQSAFARLARRPLAIAQAVRWAAERPAPREALIALAAVMPGWVARTARATRIVATSHSTR